MTTDPLAGKTVLFVDDDHLILDLAAPLLGALGCTDVILAGTHSQASAIIQSDQHFDIAIVDVTLDRQQSGFQLAEMIVALRPAVSVIQISGLHELGTMEFPPEIRVLQKPFGLTELRALFTAGSSA